ncbi:hypothetical protein WG947_02330 [Pontibacter sp. H259]|uniref:hypothetical protein n=1 Tax=Pontibacter sp. H259 TaxID=3133421 RepID=UPI0030BCDD9B
MRQPIQLILFILCFFACAASASADDFTKFKNSSLKNPNTFKSGVGFVWLSDFDSQGLMFNNSYNRYLTERVALGLNVGLVTASRYDEGKQLYSIKNTFYMGGLEASFDLLKNETVSLRLGAGGTARHRSEINSDPEGEGTFDGAVAHIRTSDVGYNGFLENDFTFLRSGIIGARVGYYSYSKGTPIFAIGMHVGFRF